MQITLIIPFDEWARVFTGRSGSCWVDDTFKQAFTDERISEKDNGQTA